MKKLHIKLNDKITVISGLYKNKYGKVTKINKKSGKIIVSEIILNTNKNQTNKIKPLKISIHHSNVKLK